MFLREVIAASKNQSCLQEFGTGSHCNEALVERAERIGCLNFPDPEKSLKNKPYLLGFGNFSGASCSKIGARGYNGC